MLLVILVTLHSSVQRSKGPGSHSSIASSIPRGELLLEAMVTSSLKDLTWVLWDGAKSGLWIFFFSPVFQLKKKNKKPTQTKNPNQNPRLLLHSQGKVQVIIQCLGIEGPLSCLWSQFDKSRVYGLMEGWGACLHLHPLAGEVLKL